MRSFSFSASPNIHFGNGKRDALPALVGVWGRRVLLVTGASSFDASEACKEIEASLRRECEVERLRVAGEPSPEVVDTAVEKYASFSPDVVVAIGGGSAMDAGKAIAGLIASGRSVMDFLEGVGRGCLYEGPATPFIAVPTTAGTGGETSKNAVLSVVGTDGFKKSFRDERLVARHVILDPELSVNCSPAVTASCGMDALTQLLESFVSRKENPMTHALAREGLCHVSWALPRAVQCGSDLQARGAMLLAATLSGLTLANAGLGAVHGLASPLGAFFPIPHGTVCGTLLYEVTRMNLRALKLRCLQNPALERYAEAARILCQRSLPALEDAHQALLERLREWEDMFAMPRLARFGVSEEDLPKIVANVSGNSMQGNPVKLTDEELIEVLRRRL
ncbi:MAG: iron-containing alcohol dehydrogenase [Zetaproteobacteria bacterium]|nr:MAG: iron-containing alcohol dehydrogenase [Zetaproteobacteria bacterium]